MTRAFLLAGLALATPLAAQGQTVQQRFDAAQAKLTANDAAGALVDLQALEAYLKSLPKPAAANLAITYAQQGEALIRLRRSADARAALEQALAGDDLARPNLTAVRDNARLLLAAIMENGFDHAGAAAQYLKLAGETAMPITRTLGYMGAARSTMFVDAPAALVHIDRALQVAEKDAAVPKAELAKVLALKGRILINGGRHAEAKELLVRAVSLRGGLITKVHQDDVGMRADAAIALLELGDAELARKYLAFTGAGRTEVMLEPPTEADLPACGGMDGLMPEESAVIEFTIMDDGRVEAPRPVYASRQGESAYAFARALSLWSWEPANAAKVKPFFRASTRVELRCSNEAKRPPLTAEFLRAASDWLETRKVADVNGTSDASRATELKARLAAAPAGSPERLATLWRLSRNTTVESRERLRLAAEAATLARQIPAPAAFQFLIALGHAGLYADANSSSWRGTRAAQYDAYGALRSRPEFAEPAMQAVLNLEIAQAAAVLKRGEDERAALTTVTQDAALSDRHPLKVAALVQLANLRAAAGQADQASALYTRTGLTAQQCALVDGGPVMLKSGSGSFPNEAMSWGFEGWTALEYDVAADGSTRNPRAVAAFPPRIFVKASENIPRTMKYRVSYRPADDLACTAMSRRVRFIIPGG